MANLAPIFRLLWLGCSGIKSRSARLGPCLVHKATLSFIGNPASFGRVNIMARVCQVTGKRPVSGNNVSHAKNRTRRRFLPNLHQHRFWVESEKRFVRLRVSSKGMRIIDKKGIEQVLGDLRARGEKV